MFRRFIFRKLSSYLQKKKGEIGEEEELPPIYIINVVNNYYGAIDTVNIREM